MIMTDIVAIGTEILRIDSGCSLEKEFTKFDGYNVAYESNHTSRNLVYTH